MAQLMDWLDERTGIRTLERVLFLRKIPRGAGWLYTLGFASLFVFIVQVVTGSLLSLSYVASPDHAYESVTFIQNTLLFGSAIRGLHHWGASALIVLVGLHLATVFVLGAYKRPREVTWVAGVVLLLITIGLGFTGYLLPWDEKAYWATTVGTNMAGTVPLIGDTVLRIIRGGTDVGAVALARFYGAHVLILPALFALTVAFHLYLVIFLGVSVPPWLWARRQEGEPAAGSTAAKDTGRGGPADDKARYEVFKKQGRPFWPDLIFEDAVISLVVFLILVTLSVLSPAPLEARADPTSSSYPPRPEWYFLFLFQLLKVFPGSLEWVGVVVIPGAIVLLLLLLPFYGRGPERRPERRPVAMGVGAVLLVGIIGLTVMAAATTPPASAVERGITLNASQVVGRSLYQANCASCHGDKGEGTDKGPTLQQVGALRDPSFIHRYIEDAKALNPTAKMTSFIPPPGGQQILTHDQVEDITQYLITFR
jgi:ubiquinol-cytochrome c reductase cytochrome b subunit